MMNFTEHVKIRRERFGAVIFETLREKVFVTNQTGASILELIENGRDIDEISEILAATYSGDPRVINGDLTEFISILKQRRVLA